MASKRQRTLRRRKKAGLRIMRGQRKGLRKVIAKIARVLEFLPLTLDRYRAQAAMREILQIEPRLRFASVDWDRFGKVCMTWNVQTDTYTYVSVRGHDNPRRGKRCNTDRSARFHDLHDSPRWHRERAEAEKGYTYLLTNEETSQLNILGPDMAQDLHKLEKLAQITQAKLEGHI